MDYNNLITVDWQGKNILMRVDFNVPVEDGQVVDDRRIRAALPSIKLLLKRGCKIILLSHLGRPKGKPEPQYSLRPIKDVLENLLQADVAFASGAIQASVIQRDHPVILLENLRFYLAEIFPDKAFDDGRKLTPDEQQQVDAFINPLAYLGDCYVNDAFGTSHRYNASMVALPQLMRRKNKPCVTGLLVAEEIRQLTRVTENPTRPFILVLGGAKVSDKLAVIKNLLPKVDHVLIGGQMAYTLLAADGKQMGESKVESSLLADMNRLLIDHRLKIVLPVDHHVIKFGGHAETTPGPDIVSGSLGVDIGPATQEQFSGIIRGAGTILWNGPLGWIEHGFTEGTEAVAEAIAEATARGATSVLGGGDTGAIIDQLGLADKMTFISTGGGATLKWLEGGELPALAALR